MPTALESLLDPISPIEFRRDYYGKRPLLIRGQARKFADLFTWDDLNRLLNGSPYPLPNVEVSTPEGRQQAPSSDAIIRACRDGASLIVHHLHLCDPKVGELARALEADLGEPMSSVGLFVSQPSRAALAKHYDRTDVLVLHLAGHKAWSLYDPTVEKPILDTPIDIHGSSPAVPSFQCELSPGDVLYFPRGYWHHALAQRELSLHVTMTIQARTGIDFLRWVADELCSDVRLRREFPLWLAGEPRELQEERLREHVAGFAEILRSRIADPATIRSFLDQRVVADRDAPSIKFPAQILESPVAQLEVRRFLRPAHQRFVLEDGTANGEFSLSVWGHVFHFPKTARPMIAFILSRTAFRYDEALVHGGELTEQDAQGILDSLLREGILDAAPGA